VTQFCKFYSTSTEEDRHTPRRKRRRRRKVAVRSAFADDEGNEDDFTIDADATVDTILSDSDNFTDELIEAEDFDVYSKKVEEPIEPPKYRMRHGRRRRDISIVYGNKVELERSNLSTPPSSNQSHESQRNHYEPYFGAAFRVPLQCNIQNVSTFAAEFGERLFHFLQTSVEPTDEYRLQQKQLLGELQQHVLDWATNKDLKYDIMIQGSYISQVDIIGSDIDIILQSNNQRTFRRDTLDRLHSLSSHLRKTGAYSHVEVIRARIPIINATHHETNIDIDIGIDIEMKMEGTIWTRNECKKSTDFVPLTRLLKRYLQDHNYNELFTGGISSFPLQCMIAYHLDRIKNITNPQSLDLNSIDTRTKNVRLAMLLMSFLSHFSDYSFLERYTYVVGNATNDSYHVDRFYRSKSGFSLLSPLDPSNDLGSSIFAMRQIQQLMRAHLNELTSLLIKWEQFVKHNPESDFTMALTLRIDRLMHKLFPSYDPPLPNS
jgi:DNA polymerase sigma